MRHRERDRDTALDDMQKVFEMFTSYRDTVM